MFNLLKDYQNALRSIHMDFPNIAKADVETLMNNIQSIRVELRRKFNKENIKLAVLDDLDYDTPQKLGRPKYNISEDTLIFYRGLGFSWNDIASLLMVSRWTVYRRIDEYGIREITGYSKISDDQLDSIILELKKQHGICLGRPMIIGHLRSMGLRIQHRRVMESLVRIDPEGANMRWRIIIRRRKYSVPGPNSLWHLDGHHSLINWGFVIHGCIDGMSRMITFLCCSCNNRAETVLTSFNEALTQYGTPSRIRTDKGGENVLVWQEMELRRGRDRGSFLAASSVHNQRIERLWRDVWNYVSCNFYYTFQAMEAEGILDVCNPIHMFVLHYIYKPRLNSVIKSFVAGWNSHPLRSERNWSPEKLWTNGMIDLRNRDMVQVAEIHGLEDYEWYGMDWYAPNPEDGDDGLSTVEVEEVDMPFDHETYQILVNLDPMADSVNFGMDLFIRALDLVSR